MPIHTFQQNDLIAAVALALPAVTAADRFKADRFAGAFMSFFKPYQD